MDTTSASPSAQRRSVRVLVSIPLRISGTKPDGNRFEGTAEATVVNMHGAKIRTQEAITTGMTIRVIMLSPYRFQMARVVKQEAEGEFGIELEQAQNFWGVYLPPADWDTAPNQTSGSALKLRSAVTIDRSHESQQTDSKVNAPTVEARTGPASPNLLSSLRISPKGSPAVIRGMSAAHVPFQEKGLLVFLDRDHASILVMPLVEPGARVSIILLPGEHVVNAVVASLSRHKVQGKWQLKLNFGTSIQIVEQTEESE
jgi:hypothetical protein